MTTLYIKTHNVTGKKYFGKTTEEDTHKYKGSGTHWSRHIKKHGYDVSTEILARFDETDSIQKLLLVETALLFSSENNITESKEWANMKPENGLDGWPKGSTHSDETKAKMSVAHIGKTSPMFGKTFSDEHKAKLSAVHTGKTLSDETKSKLSTANAGENNPMFGKTPSNESRAKNSATQTGRIYIHNIERKINKMIKPADFPEYENSGWSKGKLKNNARINLSI